MKFNINGNKYVLDFQLKGDNIFNLSIFSSDGVRVSFDGNRLFDMHNLKVVKGKEAKEKVLSLLNEIKEDVNSMLYNFSINYNIPTKLIAEMLSLICNLNVNPSKCLDISFDNLVIRLTNDFSSQSAQLSVKKKIEIMLGNEREGCIKSVINLDSTYDSDYFFTSEDCVEFLSSNIDEFKRKLYGFRTFNEKYDELLKFLKNKLG